MIHQPKLPMEVLYETIVHSKVNLQLKVSPRIVRPRINLKFIVVHLNITIVHHQHHRIHLYFKEHLLLKLRVRQQFKVHLNSKVHLHQQQTIRSSVLLHLKLVRMYLKPRVHSKVLNLGILPYVSLKVGHLVVVNLRKSPPKLMIQKVNIIYKTTQISIKSRNVEKPIQKLTTIIRIKY